ncbi:MAG: tail fiber assembly protein [Pseudomonadota bacterium]
MPPRQITAGVRAVVNPKATIELAGGAGSVPLSGSAQMRAERDKRLAACDWTQLPDAPLSDEQKAAWAAYRQQLRDIPAQYPDGAGVVWPATPA